MSTTPQPAPAQADRSGNAIALLLARMRLAAFEPLPSGAFRLFSTPPEWLHDLLPGIETTQEADLLTRFPLLETFLPEATDAWRTAGTGRVCSDMWSETLPNGR